MCGIVLTPAWTRAEPARGQPAPAAPALKEGNAAGAPWRSPDEQLQDFVLADGFVIELVTSEEQGAEKPVALNFDAAGRLWTMTATEYPLDTNDPQHAAEARRKWQEGGRDRVLIINEPLAPGPQTPRVFADGLVMPMSVLPWADGAIVAHGPEMLRLRDTDGDGKSDRRETLLSGFGVQDSHTMAHQLMWLPDGSIFAAQGVLNSGRIEDAAGRGTPVNYGKFVSFRPDGSGLRIIGAGLNNTWGVLLQRNGRLWVQEANSFDHCVAPFEEGVHFHGWNEEPYLKDAPWQPGVGEVDLGSTGLSGLARSEDRAGGFPPAWQERLLLANAVTGAINSVTARPSPEGGWKVERGPDLLTCRDRRFRPVHIAFGPDACLYIVDWYNPVISHNEVPRDHPARDKKSGRIWRVRHVSQTARSAPNVAAAPSPDLIRHLESPNTWESRAAWRQIVERKATDLIPALEALVRSATAPEEVRCLAVWCLAGLGHFDRPLWLAALENAPEDLRVELVRALRVLQPPANDAALVLRGLDDASSIRLKTEVARYLCDAAEVQPETLAVALSWMVDVPAEKVKGVQGETLPWPHYPQAFLNMWLRQALERQSVAVQSLAVSPRLLAALPPHPRSVVERAGHTRRFEAGAITAADLADPDLRSAAFACAESSPKAAAALRELADTTVEPARFGAELLDSATLTPSALKAFAAPLALRLMASDKIESAAAGLDLAAVTCSAADSAAFVAAARTLLAAHPDRRLHAVRCATAAGIQDAAFYSEMARDSGAEVALRAAAWPGWFDSSTSGEKPGVEAALREWAGSLAADEATPILAELASTTTGAHFVLNNTFPVLLAQDEFTLARLFDELAERVPGHGRLPQVEAVVARQRAARTQTAADRAAALTRVLVAGTITADPAAGRELFAGLCLTCHSAGGRGAGVAPPLDGSRQRELPALLQALLEPEAAVESVFRPFHVRLRDGTQIEGVLKSRRDNRLTVQVMGGALADISLLRVHTARYRNGHSLMPAVVGGLTDQQSADLLSVVRGL